MSVEQPLWRALAVFRLLALGYAVMQFINAADEYRHPYGGWAVMGVLTLWTLLTMYAFEKPELRSWPVLSVDLALAVLSVLATRWLDDPARVADGSLTLPTVWSSAPVLAWAIKGGWLTGAIAALVTGTANIVERGEIAQSNLHNIVLMMLAATAIGYVVELARSSERALARALQLEAATRERERLARDIHDSVLQVLALVQRRGAEIGGEAAELGRLAGEQEVALRQLVSDAPVDLEAADLPGSGVGDDPARQDVRTLLGRLAGARVSVASPGTPVLLPTPVARELAAAASAALDNVWRHAGEGARAWILLEDEPDEIIVSVRDDGPGIAPGRLEEARAAGRLGVSQSIEGRLRDVGGTALLTSVPGQGTEVELRLPRRAAALNGQT
ncbi:MacS family sensor histidine kinase [Yinghuangia sp. YIM S09857]|uniref:MacS family sensor histidine kinase n=1 Tax=Yinghuangia sp. YIM S09857 TaxID=3436929 RepID=UPI003F5296B7